MEIHIASDEILLLIQDYLNRNGWHDAVLAVERQTGIRLRSYGAELDFFRQLLLDGQWDDAERFVAALCSRPNFDHRRVRFLLRRQRFLETIAQRDLGDAVLELVDGLKELEDSCPPEEFQSLCYCLTLTKVTDHPDFTNWTVTGSRLATFERCLEQFAAIYPAQVRRRQGVVEPNRLVQMLKQAILYQMSVAATKVDVDLRPGRRSYTLLHDIDFRRTMEAAPSGEYTIMSRITDPAHALRSVRFRPDSAQIATGSASCCLRICAADGDQHKRLPIVAKFADHHNGGIYSIDWSRDGRWLATGSSDHCVKVLNIETGRSWTTTHSGTIRSILFGDDQTTVIGAGSGDYTIRIWDYQHQQPGPRRTLSGHTDVIVGMAMRDRTLVSASFDGVLNHWRKEERVSSITMEPLMACALSSDARTAFVVHTNGSSGAWDLSMQRPIWQRPAPRPSSGRVLALSGDDRLLLLSSDDGTMHIVDAQDGQLLDSMSDGHSQTVIQAQWDPATATRFVTCSKDRTMALWTHRSQKGEHY